MLDIFFIDVLTGQEISRTPSGRIPPNAYLFNHTTGLYSPYVGVRKLGNIITKDNSIWLVSHISSASPTFDISPDNVYNIFSSIKCAHPDESLTIHYTNNIASSFKFANFTQRYETLIPIIKLFPNSILIH